VVVRHGPAGDEVIGYVRTGEPVGEMSLLSGETRTASVYALRDTELLSLTRIEFEEIFDEEPDFASAIARAILARTRHPDTKFQQSSPRVFALIASSPSVDIDRYADRLARSIARFQMTVKTITETSPDFDYLGFDDVESKHDVVLLAAKVSDSSWYRFVLRHADRFFVFARRDARPPRPFPLSPSETSPARRFRLVDLVMIHEGRQLDTIEDWVDAIDGNRVFHWTNQASADRLARVIAGKTVGLVLSGGGARADAHIGAVRALRERGLPIDFVCGASMGGVIAACVAMGWDDDEIEARIRDAFVASNPLGDYVLPVVALTRGRLVEERLQRHFGEKLIEELEVPFFCVSSELTEGVERIHRRGVLRHALRASISLPGILPPVVDGNRLLVDGAVMNNFPTDIMANLHRGVTIGLDVARQGTISVDAFVDPPGFFSWVRHHGFGSAPPIITLLMRAATARREQTHKVHPADIMIAPAAAGVELRDWKKYDEAVAAGYEAACAALDEQWDTLAPIADAARDA